MIDQRKLSALQLESIVYASQQHEQFLPDGNRAGFLIGDGAGVGKGRTIAGIIFENYLKVSGQFTNFCSNCSRNTFLSILILLLSGEEEGHLGLRV